MAGTLRADEVRRYERDGVVHPIRVLDDAEAQHLLARLEAVEQHRAGRIPPALNVKIHLLLPWLWDLVHDRRILDPVESLLGPDILCWGSNFFAKEPHDRRHVPWHQDTTYWGLSEPRALTAWVALTPSRLENGCLQVARGTHRSPLRHVETKDEASMLPIRERLVEGVDPALTELVELSSGEMSLHHGRLAHGSAANEGSHRRVGFAIRYVASDVGLAGTARSTATLVRGRDFGRFGLEEAPGGEFDADALRRYKPVLRSWMSAVTEAVEAYRGRPGQG
ncbi:phytanoyl-CoA dioxygenase family protein [Reyranella sp.]|uniref:phytanoyl-CoA dioxygenase family protein n=1 Tax=Reyranella sp. TaxID=1929291 RepID=UPI003BA99EF9